MSSATRDHNRQADELVVCTSRRDPVITRAAGAGAGAGARSFVPSCRGEEEGDAGLGLRNYDARVVLFHDFYDAN